MIGHFKNVENFNRILWEDAELESIEISYDSFQIKVQETTGNIKLICCSGYIGYENIGFWDEVIIEKAVVFSSHELIDNSIKSINSRLGEPIPDSGSNFRNKKAWDLLEIKFIDGSAISVVMSELTVIEVNT